MGLEAMVGTRATMARSFSWEVLKQQLREATTHEGKKHTHYIMCTKLYQEAEDADPKWWDEYISECKSTGRRP